MKAQRKKWLEDKIKRVQLLENYKVGTSIETLAKEMGIAPTEIIKLDSNETFFISREFLTRLMKQVADECDLRIYPQEEKDRLREKLCDYLNTTEDSIIIGNSSDELIDRVVRFFLEKGDNAISIMPSFPIYKYTVNHQNATFTEVPLRRDFKLDLERILSAVKPKSKLLFLCSPNNPTANQFGRDEITVLIEKFPGIVIVDEAYAEYAEYSMVPMLEKFENLIVLRTFSKAFGLAGLRLGYAVANPSIAKTLSATVASPYPVSSFTLRMGLKLLENRQIVESAVERLKTERRTLIQKLDSVNGVRSFESKTNFVLFSTTKSHEEVYQNLLKQGILIKRLGNLLHLDNCLRTTVGLPKMNKKLLETMEEVMER
ncbi:histidinol-phosphate transaminase [Candidatus Bathyarchaeota archaeon]|nr:histidinol-phosphate transaminase [Candidatus Bathyarchaeota archaeon]